MVRYLETRVVSLNQFVKKITEAYPSAQPNVPAASQKNQLMVTAGEKVKCKYSTHSLTFLKKVRTGQILI